MRRALALLLLGLLPACGGAAAEDGTDTADLTSSDSAIVTLAGSAQKTLYVSLDAKQSTKVGDALAAAVARGVLVRGLLVDGDHDATWTMQQHLESCGVDLDVVSSSPATGVVAIGDGTALLAGAGKVTKETDAAKVAALAKKFDDALAVGDVPRAGALVASDTVKVLPMPPESGDARLAEILAAAKTSIDLSIYQLEERRMIAALVAAAGRGVKVRVMLEPKTVGAANFDGVSRELTAGGVDLHPTPPSFDAHHNVDHAKFCVVDDKELLFATGNMVRSGLGGVSLGPYQNRDFWVEDGRPAQVKAAKAVFEADLARSSTSGLDTSALVLTPDNADDAITQLVDGASQRLLVYNQSLEDDALIARLVAAKKRGVDVHVLLGFQPPFGGQPSKNDAALATLKDARITAQYLKAHYLHGKAIVADQKVYIGSQNFTNGGLHTNRELGEILDDAGAVRAVADAFAKDEAAPGL
jgi:hypothetical protein